MITISLNTVGFSMSNLSLSPLAVGFSYARYSLKARLKHKKRSPQMRRIRKEEYCRAEFSQDAPLAIAIGACIFNSLLFPIPPSSENDENSLIDSTDARFAIMGIISFIPYFNWLSWVFAWMDTREQRYIVYSFLYLAPYLRSNLSLSPEDSWLPTASIIICIFHIQLEASIRNGSFKGFQLLNEAAENLTATKNGPSKGHKMIYRKDSMVGGNLPSAKEREIREIEYWRVPKESMEGHEQLSHGSEEDETEKH